MDGTKKKKLNHLGLGKRLNKKGKKTNMLHIISYVNTSFLAFGRHATIHIISDGKHRAIDYGKNLQMKV